MHAYVESLTAPLLSTTGHDAEDLDPDPFVTLFRTQLASIQQCQRKVQRKLDKQSDLRKAHRSSQTAQLGHLSSLFTSIEAAHERLETRMNDATGTIATIGEHLELVDQHKRTAEDALGLLRLFIQLNDGEAQAFEALVASPEVMDEKTQAGWLKAAKTLQRLVTVARDVDLPAVSAAQAKIQGLAEALEKTVLHDFDAAYEEHDLERMSVALRPSVQSRSLLVLMEGGYRKMRRS